MKANIGFLRVVVRQKNMWEQQGNESSGAFPPKNPKFRKSSHHPILAHFANCAPKTFPEPLRVFDTFSPNPSHHPILAHFPNLSLGYLTSAVAPLAHHPSLRVAALVVFLVFMVTLLCFFASARIVLVSSYLRRMVSPSVQPVRQTFLVCRLGS